MKKNHSIIIVAYSHNRAIGKDNQLLWHLADDMAFFKKMTTGKTVLMGKNTYLSIPKKFRPLPNRLNIVISSQEPIEHSENLVWYKTIDDAFSDLKDKLEDIYIIGGASIYSQTLKFANRILATEVEAEIIGDTHFPELNPAEWSKKVLESHSKNEKNDYNFKIVQYTRKTIPNL